MANPPRPHGRILIVEDEGIVASDIGQCLEDAGFEVTGIAASAEDAIQEVERAAPALVLMDVRIQGELDGIQAGDLLHRRYALPIIYLTAHGDRDTVERVKQTEAMAFVLKPFKPTELINTIDIALHRAQADRELREREQWFAAAMGSIGDAVLSIDQNDRIRFINQAAETLTECPHPTALGRPIDDLVKVAPGEKGCLERLRAIFHLDAGAPAEGYHPADEFQILTPSGLSRWVMARGATLAGPHDRSARVVVLQDITGRRQAEEALQTTLRELLEKTAQLEAANKELEAFSYSVSHHLRAPLRAVNGFAHLLLEEHKAGLSAEAQNYLERVWQAGVHMGKLIDDLLAFSRLGRQPLNKKLVRVNEIVRLAIEDLRDDQAGRQIELVIAEMGCCQADPSLLRQVFMNLLSNSIKYTRTRAVARIEVGKLGAEEAFFVRDNGIGFDMRYSEKLFGVFQRLHSMREFEGTGVGLATVQRIVRRHGGEIWAEAEVDKGATFYFTLAPPSDAAGQEATRQEQV